jgi:hypothetical protein
MIPPIKPIEYLYQMATGENRMWSKLKGREKEKERSGLSE